MQPTDTETPEHASALLREVMGELEHLRELEAPLLSRRDALVAELVDIGWSYAKVAAVCGLSRGRIGQIVHARRLPVAQD